MTFRSWLSRRALGTGLRFEDERARRSVLARGPRSLGKGGKRPSLEWLERRIVLTVDHWTGLGADANFSTPGNWDTLAVPAAGDTIVFDGSAAQKTAVMDAGFNHGVAALTVSADWNGKITLATPLTVTGAMNLASGTLTGNVDIEVDGAMNWTGGTISGSGSVTTKGGLTLGLNSLALDGRTLNLASDTLVNDHGGSEGMFLYNNAVINNEAGQTFDIQTDWGPAISEGGSGTFNNAGIVQKSAGTGYFGIDSVFNNTGTVLAESGSLLAGVTGTDSGTDTVSAGATLFVGEVNFTANSTIDGAGTVTFQGGNSPTTVAAHYNVTGSTTFNAQALENIGGFSPITFTGPIASLVGGTNSLQVLNGITVVFNTAVPGVGGSPNINYAEADFNGGAPITASTLSLNGTLGGSDTWTITGLVDTKPGVQYQGSLKGSGTLNIQGVFNDPYGTWSGWTVNNQGTAHIGNVSLSHGAVLNNLAGAKLDLGGFNDSNGQDAGGFLRGTGTETLTNAGTIISTSAGSNTSSIDAMSLTGNGTIEVDSGTLQVGYTPSDSATLSTYDGSIVVEPGAVLSANTLSLGPDSDVSGAGSVSIPNGGSVTIGGGYELTGPTTVGGALAFESDAIVSSPITLTTNSGLTSLSAKGQVTFDAPVTAAGNQSSTAYLSAAGHVIFNAPLALTQATIEGPGDFTARGGLSLQGFIRIASLNGGGTLNNAGAAVWDGQQALDIEQGGTFANESGATLNVTGGTNPYGIANYGGTFRNAGTMVVSAGSTQVAVSATVVNTGTLAVQSGTLALPAIRIDGAGALTGSPAGTLLLSGGITGGLTGSTTNAAQFAPQAGVQLVVGFDSSDPTIPFEVMSNDLGAVSAGFVHNFAYNALTIQVPAAPSEFGSPLTATVQLVDQSRNAGGSSPEALYVDTLVVQGQPGGDSSNSTGGTLDLNGLHVYARTAQIDPSVKVINGTISLVGDGGPLSLGGPTPGTIGKAGEADDWTFFGRAGQLFAATLNTGGAAVPSPALGLGQLTLVDPSGQVVATASSTEAGADVALSGIHLTADGVYHVQVKAATSQPSGTGNYVLRVFDTTPHNGALTPGQNASGVLSTSFSTDTWTFAATAGTVVQFHMLNAASSGIQFDLTGPSGYSGFINQTIDSGPLTLPSDGTYTVSVHGAQGATGGYAFRVDEPNPTALTLGTPYSGSLVAGGQGQLFKVTLAQAGPLKVSLADASAADHDELYLSYGAPPTRATHDYAAPSAGSAAQQVVVPAAAPGDWYILVYGESVPSPSTYTLLADVSNVLVSAASPTKVGSASPITLSVSGAGFDAQSTVSLVTADGATSYTASSVQVDSSTQLTGNFAAGAVPPGTYGVKVTRGDGTSAILPGSVTIVAGGAGNLQTSLLVPFPVGYHQPSTLFVEYRNTGDAAMPAPVLELTGVMKGTAGALLSLDPADANLAFTTDTTPPGFSQSVQILASGATPGLLQPGEAVTVPVYYAGWLHSQWDLNRPPITFNLNVTYANATAPMHWATVKDQLRPPSISPAAWDGIFPNLVASVGATAGDYVSQLDAIAGYLGHLGKTVTDVGRLWDFNVETAIGFSPITSLAGSTDASADTPGLPLTFAREFGPTIVDRNRKSPLGWGWDENWDLSLQADAAGNVVVNGPDGVARTFVHSAAGYVAQPGDHGTLTALPDGSFTLLEKTGQLTAFLPDGRLNYVADATGNTITAGYTGSQLTSLKASSGQSLTLHYNAAGLITSVSDSVGRTTTYAYNALGELVGVTDPAGLTTQYAYDDSSAAATAHALETITSADGSTRSFAYDSQGRLIDTHLDANVEDVAFGYDNFGTVSIKDAAQQQDPTSFGTQVFFDDRGLPVRLQEPLHSPLSFAYDANLNLTSVTDSQGQSYRYAYDADGNLVSSTDPLNDTQQFAYTSLPATAGSNAVGSFDRLASSRDANGNLTQYQSDTSGNMRSVTYADSSKESFTFDPLGNPLSFTNRRGNTVNELYDSAGHVTSMTFDDGTRVDYTYDSHGNLVAATDASGTTTLTYDPADRLTSVSYPGGRSLTFTYDAFGRRLKMVDQDGFTVNYKYDAIGRLLALTDGQNNPIVSYTYDAAGRLARKDLGNGTFTTYAYDASGQLLSLVNHAPDGSVNSRFDYTYDDLGRRTSMTTAGGTWHYSYDAAGRLTAVDGPGGPIQYRYDAAGNRTAVTDSSGTTTYTVNALNQATKVGGATLVYDADGNLISRSDGNTTDTYQYDPLNRLIGTTTPGGTWTYQYDPLGNLASVADNTGARTDELYDPTGLGALVGQYQGGQAVHYTYGLGLTSRVDSNGAAFYDFDAQGSTAGLTGAAGTYLNTYSYLPFGEVVSATGHVPNPFTYVGEAGIMSQGNGLDFMRARFYAPDLGSFTSVDPLQLLTGAPYAYVHGDPVDSVDPTGLVDMGTLAQRAFQANSFRKGFQAGGRATYFFLTTRQDSQYGSAQYDMAESTGDTEALNAARAAHSTAAFKFAQTGIDQFKAGFQGDIFGLMGWGTGAVVAGVLMARHTVVVHLPGGGSGGSSSATDAGTSQDPNDKIGPAAFGPAGFLRPDGPFLYRVDFENDPTASAPAQVVTVTDQLDPNLDWNTFALTDVGFGSTEIVIPAGSRHYQTTVPVTVNGKTFDVAVELGIHSETGQVYATFQSLDPQTLLPPDILTGFLPPEDGTGRGMGHFGYLVAPKAGLPTGTQIRNTAVIVFDDNPPLATNLVDDHDPSKGTDPSKEVLRTIDVGAPSSAVQPLAAATTSPTVTVSWSGQDDAGGSGIAGYTVYVSDNGGPFTPWLVDVSQTSAPFTGTSGHTYAFLSVAADNVGNVQAMPTTAQATTTFQIAAGQPSQPVLDAQSDTGTSPSDGITRNNGSSAAPLVFDVAETPDQSDVFRLFDVTNPNQPVLIAGPTQATHGTITVSGMALADGTHKIAATTALDANSPQSALSPASTITVLTGLRVLNVSVSNQTYRALPGGQIVVNFSGPLAGLAPDLPNGSGFAGLPSAVTLTPRGPGGVFAPPTGLNGGSEPIPAVLVYHVNADGTSTITLTPRKPLSTDLYRVTIAAALADVAGNPVLAANGQPGASQVQFTLRSAAITSQPLTVVSFTTLQGTVKLNGKTIPQPDAIAIAFNKAVDPLTVNRNTVQLLAGPRKTAVAAALAYSPTNHTVYLTPQVKLAPGTTYTVVVVGNGKPNASVTDDQSFPSLGRAMTRTFMTTFTVKSGVVPRAPLVAIAKNGHLQATPGFGPARATGFGYASIPFSEPLNPATLSRATVALTLASGGLNDGAFDAADPPLNAQVAFNPNTDTLIIVPTEPVAGGTYRYTLGALRATNGNLLKAPNGKLPVTDTFTVKGGVSASRVLHAAGIATPRESSRWPSGPLGTGGF